MSARKRTRAKSARAKQPSKPATVPLAAGHARVLFGLAVAGFLVASYLSYVHYRLHADPGWRSACDLDERVTCDAVVVSPYAVIFHMPISMIGMWFYLGVGLLALATLRGRPWTFPRSPAVVVFVAGLVATAASIALATVSVVAIGALCPACALTYGINAALAVTGWLAIRRSGELVGAALRAEGRYWKRRRWLVLGASLGILALLGAGFVVYSHSAGGSVICEAVAEAEVSGRRPIEVVIYSDFQCPHCQNVARDLRSIPKDRGVRFVPRHYPLDMTCNVHAKTSRHPGSCLLALAAICAEAQGHVFEFSDALFEGKASASETDLVALATTLGLNGDAFQQCLGSSQASQLLQDSIARAADEAVHATPTLFVNGRRHVGRLDTDDLQCLNTGASIPP